MFFQFSTNTGIFVDFPAKITWDIGYTRRDEIKITAEGTDLDIYLITGGSPREVVRRFRAAIRRGLEKAGAITRQ